MNIIMLLTGIIIGAVIGWLAFRILAIKTGGLSKEEAEVLRTDLSTLNKEKIKSEANLLNIENTLRGVREELGAERAAAQTLRAEAAGKDADLRNLGEKLATQKAEMEELRKKFTLEFENLANRILEEKAKRFTEQNKENLGTILNPLQERIKEFQKKVEETYTTESKERLSLEREVKRLAELNQQVSKEAADLTKALKGEAKTQGNWGEMILEKILERSGLREGQEFTVQETKATEDGGWLRPDVVVYLPEDKNVVVDSKVSLTAYERFSSAEDPMDREHHLAEHVSSVRGHIKGLKQKSYQKLYGINTPDFVLMFMPLEPAFSAALNADDRLFSDAFEQGVILVSPTTLLTTLRTIANIWRQERQHRNVLEIAKQAGDLYDKFVGFTDDLLDIGKKLEDAQVAHGEAVKKLSTGKGNLVRRAESIRELGAKTSKLLPRDLVERADSLPEGLTTAD